MFFFSDNFISIRKVAGVKLNHQDVSIDISAIIIPNSDVRIYVIDEKSLNSANTDQEIKIQESEIVEKINLN